MIFFVIREEFKLRDFVQFYPCLKQVPRYIIFHSFVKIQETFLSNAERRFHVQLEKNLYAEMSTIFMVRNLPIIIKVYKILTSNPIKI